MKKIFTIVAMTFLWFMSLSAQVPQKLTYQSVIRDAAGNVINNQDLEVQITILQGSIEGPVVYSENHTTATTVNGVITLEVGGGKTSYDFTSIDWSDGPYYIRSTAELNGKSISVTSQLLSVPYSLYAHRAFLADKVNEQFLEDIIAAKIQSALEEQNVAWEDKIQKALDERDAIWQGKLEALEAVLDSITAQQATPVDTIPSDTIPSDTIPSDTTVAPVDTIPADTVNVDTAIKSAAIHGVLPGKFSMGKDLKVHFSKGMLQYLAYKNVWRFAKTQHEMIGKKFSDYWMYPAKGWVDRYEHGAGTVDKPECDYDLRDYIYWGIHYDYWTDGQMGGQAVHNGGNKANKWWNPSAEEWRYLFAERENADKLIAKGEVNGIKGYIILPDDWVTPSEIAFTPLSEDCSINTYDKKGWEKMESLGAVFMPFASYWSWGGMESTSIFLSEKYKCPVWNNEQGWIDNDPIDELNSGRENFYLRLVTTDSTAIEIMRGEDIENEDLDGEDDVTPNNYMAEDQPDLSNVDMKAGLLNGKFSVSDTKQVNFSQGNLQYNSESKTWRFAEAQYYHITPSGWEQNSLRSEEGWTDAFCWGSSGYAYGPLFRLTHDDFFESVPDISGTKYDWGVYNAISNGGNTPNIWRTLTGEEWKYLASRYKDGRSLCIPAKVDGTTGLLLLPDDWDFNNGITLSWGEEDATTNYSINIIKKEQWSQIESLGGVFLPSAGIVQYGRTFDADDLGYTNWIDGSYWGSTQYDKYMYSWGVLIYVKSVEPYEDPNPYIYDIGPKQDGIRRHVGCSVRLVRDVTE